MRLVVLSGRHLAPETHNRNVVPPLEDALASFPLTNAQVTGLLQPGYTDLTITVVLNVQVPTTGVYFIDNLRFCHGSGL